MNSTSLSPRRLLAAAAGVVVGLGGTLAIATSPAQAGEEDKPPEPHPDLHIVDCQVQEYSYQSEYTDSAPRRAVLEPDGDPVVVWQSGDWPEGDDPGGPDDWGDSWAIGGDGKITVVAAIAQVPDGDIYAEYWKDSEWKPDTRIDDWGYEYQCSKVGELDVTQPTCEKPGVLTIPGLHEDDKGKERHLVYLRQEIDEDGEPDWVKPGTHDLDPGRYEITALRYGGEKGYQKVWTVDVEEPECESPSPEPSEEPGGEGGGDELPETGMTTGVVAGAAVVLLAAGGGLFLAARRRRITFTA